MLSWRIRLTARASEKKRSTRSLRSLHSRDSTLIATRLPICGCTALVDAAHAADAEQARDAIRADRRAEQQVVADRRERRPVVRHTTRQPAAPHPHSRAHEHRPRMLARPIARPATSGAGQTCPPAGHARDRNRAKSRGEIGWRAACCSRASHAERIDDRPRERVLRRGRPRDRRRGAPRGPARHRRAHHPALAVAAELVRASGGVGGAVARIAARARAGRSASARRAPRASRPRSSSGAARSRSIAAPRDASAGPRTCIACVAPRLAGLRRRCSS